MHARRYFHKVLESDQARMGPALLLIGQLYRVEKQARPLASSDRLQLRELQAKPILDKLRDYLEEIQAEILPKSPAGKAVRYTLKNWTVLTCYCEDGDLEIDNNATERAIRGVAVGRNNWAFFGSDQGGKTAAVLRSFVASCQRWCQSPCLVRGCCPALLPSRSPDSPNFSPITGRLPRLDPRQNSLPNPLRLGRVILSRLLRTLL